MLCSLVNGYECFRGTHCPCLSLITKTVAADSWKVLVHVYQRTKSLCISAEPNDRTQCRTAVSQPHCSFLVPAAISQHATHFETTFHNVNALKKNPNKWTRKIHVNSIAASSLGSPAFRSSRRQDILTGISWFSSVPPNFELVCVIWGLWFHGREYDDQCLPGCDVVLEGKLRPCFICNVVLIISEPRNKKIRNSKNNLYKNNNIQKYVVLFMLQCSFVCLLLLYKQSITRLAAAKARGAVTDRKMNTLNGEKKIMRSTNFKLLDEIQWNLINN